MFSIPNMPLSTGKSQANGGKSYHHTQWFHEIKSKDESDDHPLILESLSKPRNFAVAQNAAIDFYIVDTSSVPIPSDWRGS